MSPSSDGASAMYAFFSVAWGVYLAKLFIEKWALKSSASQDFRRSGEGTSYSNGGPAYTYERPHHHDARPPYTSNDNRPMYSNGRIPHYRGDFSTEENDRAIALALSEEDHSEFLIPNHFCFFVLFCFFLVLYKVSYDCLLGILFFVYDSSWNVTWKKERSPMLPLL